ncbi:MAG: 3-isopropylmalate dehydratase large subunit [Bdellovibrionales bacterium]|nr:3-isopropylmalate dehydratase large subunit [Bdellovibrionales bacterium]
MGTLVEEILSRKIGRRVTAGEIIFADLDYMMTHDNTTPLAIKAYRDVGKPIFDKNKIVIHFDHAYPAPNLKAAEAQKRIVDFIKENDLPNFYHQGICHQVMIEEGFVKPGHIIIGGDSHSNTYGAFAALGVGFGSTEIGVSWCTGKTWFRVPETVHVVLNGEATPGVTAKDIMLAVLRELTATGGRGKSLEFSGSFIENCSMPDRIVFPNMSTEVGGTCGLIAVDDTTIGFLENETEAVGPFERIVPVEAEYERVVEIDVSSLTPQVACHPKVDNVKSIEEMSGLPIDEVFIGTCTNGRYEDLAEAAAILRGRKVNRFTRTIITPASRKVYEKALQNGLIQVFHDAGCTIGVTGCGACIGRHGGLLGPGERAFTTMNRNFVGRMGSPESEIYLGSPAAAAATAIEGKITDPRPYMQ